MPTLPTFDRSPAAAIPCTTTQNTITGTSIFDQLDEAVAERLHLKGEVGISHAEGDAQHGSAMTTWKKSDLKDLGHGSSSLGWCFDWTRLGGPSGPSAYLVVFDGDVSSVRDNEECALARDRATRARARRGLRRGGGGHSLTIADLKSNI